MDNGLMNSHPLRLKGCRQNNLRNFSLTLPKQQVIAITGVSGSGKSSLAFDTIYAESQRRFLEYLSPQVRRWIKQMPRPEVDLIEGLSPSLAIDQHRRALSSRGTVATHTDIYDFLCLLYARVGVQHSPATGKPLSRLTKQQISEAILQDYPIGSRIQLIAPIRRDRETLSDAVQRLQKMGFVRLRIDGIELEEGQELPLSGQVEVVVDRLQMHEGVRDRLGASVITALELSHGILKVQEGTRGAEAFYTEVYLCPESGMAFAPLTPADLNPNSPHGACPNCQGAGCGACNQSGLQPVALACRIAGKNIVEICQLRVEDLAEEMPRWSFGKTEQVIADEILPEIGSRLAFLTEVGLGYLELDRDGGSLSEGEAQRVQLAALIGAKLSGILYVLDEPSRGLHRRDVGYLANVLRFLTDLGNTVLLVEHDKTLIRSADQIVEIGPGAGLHGGRLLFQGSLPELIANQESPTGAWLTGSGSRPKAKGRREAKQSLRVRNATLHNLQKATVDIPLGILVGIYGVSGSGKSTLALDIVAHQLQEWMAHETPCPNLEGYEQVQRMSLTEQRIAGATARSNPASYIDLMDILRSLFAQTKLAQARGYTPTRFSLNRPGGRCEACEGLGLTRVDMGFLPDLYVPCEVCNGKRYHYETLQVLWEGLSIADVLDLSAEDALAVFAYFPEVARRLQLMVELGLAYLCLGQSFTTLSGGEMQRLKLISELARKQTKPTLYIMDEPCVGLHFSDVAKLAAILNRLVDAGHSVIVVDHNLELVNECDWIIELGPEGGPKGGKVIFEGTPEKLLKAKTATGQCLREDQRSD